MTKSSQRTSRPRPAKESADYIHGAVSNHLPAKRIILDVSEDGAGTSGIMKYRRQLHRPGHGR